MASTCVWLPYRDSACLVLGCVRVCVLPQRLSKGMDDRGRLRDAFYLIDKDHTPAARLCLAAALAGGGPRFGRANALTPSKANDGKILVSVDLNEINYKPLPTRSPAVTTLGFERERVRADPRSRARRS